MSVRVPVHRWAAVLFGIVTLLVGATTPAQAASYEPYGAFVIRNVNSGLCLEVADWSTTPGAPVRQWDCHRGANQQWLYYMGSDRSDVIYLVNRNSEQCLEIGGWNSNNGTANQWPCKWNGQLGNQTWLRSSGSPRNIVTDGVTFVYNMCLEIPDWSKARGTQARIYPCHSGDNMKWVFEPA